MPRYVAFLRGVSPTNAKSADLQRAFEMAGFANVRTVLSSGNVAFDARNASESAVIRKAVAALATELGRSFHTIVRATAALRTLIEADPYAAFQLPAQAKRVVTFLGDAQPRKVSLPFQQDGVYVLTIANREALIAYTPNPRGPVFMTIIEKTFGANVTTRTWETVKKCAAA